MAGVDDANGWLKFLSVLWDRHKRKRWFRRVYSGEEPAAADDEWRRWNRTILDFDPVPLLEQLAALKQSGREHDIAVYYGADHNLKMVDGGEEAPFRRKLADWLSSMSR